MGDDGGSGNCLVVASTPRAWSGVWLRAVFRQTNRALLIHTYPECIFSSIFYSSLFFALMYLILYKRVLCAVTTSARVSPLLLRPRTLSNAIKKKETRRKFFVPHNDNNDNDGQGAL